MIFSLDYHGGEKDRTFSAEGIISFFGVIGDYLNNFLVRALKNGFEKKKPVHKIEIDMRFKINGKEMTDNESKELMNMYPEVMGFTKEALIDMLTEKKT